MQRTRATAGVGRDTPAARRSLPNVWRHEPLGEFCNCLAQSANLDSRFPSLALMPAPQGDLDKERSPALRARDGALGREGGVIPSICLDAVAPHSFHVPTTQPPSKRLQVSPEQQLLVVGLRFVVGYRDGYREEAGS